MTPQIFFKIEWHSSQLLGHITQWPAFFKNALSWKGMLHSNHAPFWRQPNLMTTLLSDIKAGPLAPQGNTEMGHPNSRILCRVKRSLCWDYFIPPSFSAQYQFSPFLIGLDPERKAQVTSCAIISYNLFPQELRLQHIL